MAKIISIDLGTTYFKISLFDREGRLCDTCRITPPIAAAQAGYVELPADAFCNAIAQGITELGNRSDGGLGEVEAVTFATQSNSFVLLDAKDRPLTPLILWTDRRAIRLEEEVRRRCGIPEFSATAGFSGLNFQCMAAKLLWLQEQSPEIWRRTSRLCLISDYLTLLLTGQHVTEAGASGLTGLLNIHRCQWNPEMLARFEIDEHCLPRVVRAGTDLGPLDPRVAKRFGLPVSCRFVVGCLDQYAGAIGAGNVEPGMISETTGTVVAAVCCTDRFSTQLNPVVLQGPAFREGLYWRMAFSEISANYLQWYRDQLPERPDFDELIALAELIEPGAEGLRLRADVGLSSPEQVFEGLADRHSRGHRVRCILEAVACALGDHMAALYDDALPDQIRCAGGAARSGLWLQIKADVLGVATTTTVCPEPTSLGAAILARASLDATDVRTVAQQWVCLRPPYCPDPERHQQYQMLKSKLSEFFDASHR